MGYRNMDDLRGCQEEHEMTQELRMDYLRCAVDIDHFSRNYFTITTLDYGIQKMVPRKFQQKILKCAAKPPDNKRHLLLKIGRQSGKSTVVSLHVLHYILFNKHKRVAILANQESGAKELLERIKFAYRNLPLWLQQGVVEWNKKSIKLENGCEIIIGSTSGESITGKSINLLILDEFAKVPNHVADDFIRSSYPVISSGKTTQIIIISTPKGMNHFYDFWLRALDVDSDFYPIEVPYWDIPGRTEEWRLKEIKNIGEVSFKQEYECVFLGSSSTLVEGAVLAKIKAVDHISMKWNGAFLIYEKPIKNCVYIIGSDVGKGVGSDYSVLQVLKVISPYKMVQVAVFSSNKISPTKFAKITRDVCEYYNMAWLLMETNDIGAVPATKLWEDYEYENMVIDDGNEYGVRANRGNKSRAHDQLKEYIENMYLSVFDNKTIQELSRYEESGIGTFKAASGHDDHVTSLLWAVYITKTPMWEDILMEIGYDIDGIDDDDDIYSDSMWDDDGLDMEDVWDEEDEDLPIIVIN